MTIDDDRLPDVMLRVIDEDGGGVWIDPDDEAQLTQATRTLVTSGVDQLLTLTTVGGQEWSVPASRIREWFRSTREARRLDTAIVTLHEREYAEDRRATWPDAPGD